MVPVSVPFEDQLAKVSGTVLKVYMDDPHHRAEHALLYYFNKADILRESAEILMAHGGLTSVVTMLTGMALEVLIKGIGRALSNPPPPTHQLVKLAEHVGIPLEADERILLDAMSEHVYWAGRYTAPRNAADWERAREIQAKQFRPTGNLANLEIRNRTITPDTFGALWTKFSSYYWRAQEARLESAAFSFEERLASPEDGLDG